MQVISEFDKLTSSYDVESFLLSQERATVLNQARIFNIYKGVENQIPIIIAAVDHGKICAYTVGAIISEQSGLLGRLTSRCIIPGGILFSNETALQAILLELNRINNGRAIYTNIGNPCDNSDVAHVFKSCGYDFEPHLNFLIDLRHGEEQVWKKISDKRRNKIRKAIKSGLNAYVTYEMNDFDRIYEVLKATYDRASLPISDSSLFRAFYDEYGKTKQFAIVRVELDGKLIAVRILLLYKRRIYDWYAGADPEYLSNNPNDLAVWTALMWGINNAYELFDFGGAGHPDVPYGVREFKRVFGGREVNFGLYRRVNNRFGYRLLLLGKKMYSKIKGKKKQH